MDITGTALGEGPPKPDEWVYGCLFCETGKETFVEQHIANIDSRLRATAVRQMKRITHLGETRLQARVVFPGYVFLEAQASDLRPEALRVPGVLSLLRAADGDWRLHGRDRDFAQWVFSCHGMIAMSKAYKEGDRVRIVSGPLKEFEGSILRLDKRNRNGQIAIQLGERTVKVWLGFELVDPVDTASASHPGSPGTSALPT